MSPNITTKTNPGEAPEPAKPAYKPACGKRNMEGIKFQVQNPVRLIQIKRYWINVINVVGKLDLSFQPMSISKAIISPV